MSEILCPKCGSDNVHADRKGFSTGKAIAGTIVGNPVIGAIAGTHGSSKIILTCLDCGRQFKPGEQMQVIRHNTDELPKGARVIERVDEERSYAIVCSYCGRKSSTEPGNCPQCGRRFTAPEKEAAKQAAIERANSGGSGCLGVLVALVIFGGVLVWIN